MDDVLVFFSIAACACALFLRLLPHRMATGTLAVDHWYWKAYIETYRRERQFPPVLPQYLLDEHQWYPPLFPRLLLSLPDAVFDRWSRWVSIMIDLFRMGLLLAATFWLTAGDAYAVGLAGLLYATTPILVSYNAQLNPRGLGALFLDGLILLLIWRYLLDGPLWVWAPILVFAGLILLTHKMTTQLFWFLCIAAGLVLGEWRFLALIPASILMAMLFSKGYYQKVLYAHLDIVTFWNRNWRWLQAHPILESPIYREPGYETPTKFHRKGARGVFRHLSYLLGFNPGAWSVAAACIISLLYAGRDMSPVVPWMGTWLGMTLLFAVLTVFFPPLKCLGSGYYYLFNAAFPTALVAGVLLSKGENTSTLALLVFAILGNSAALLAYYRNLKSARRQPDFQETLDFVKDLPKATVMCLPPQWYDVVAYKTRQTVLYGGHGFGFKLLEPTYPRLLVPVKEILARYQVRYLITLKDYLTERFIADLPCESIKSFGEYQVFLLKP